MLKNCAIAFHINSFRYFSLKEMIECSSLDCFSPVIAISRHLSFNLPNIIPPLENITKE